MTERTSGFSISLEERAIDERSSRIIELTFAASSLRDICTLAVIAHFATRDDVSAKVPSSCSGTINLSVIRSGMESRSCHWHDSAAKFPAASDSSHLCCHSSLDARFCTCFRSIRNTHRGTPRQRCSRCTRGIALRVKIERFPRECLPGNASPSDHARVQGSKAKRVLAAARNDEAFAARCLAEGVGRKFDARGEKSEGREAY
jgi:hypothetical protein